MVARRGEREAHHRRDERVGAFEEVRPSALHTGAVSTGIVDFLARVVVAVTNARILRQELSGAKNYPGGSNQPRRIPSPPSSAWDRMKSQTSFAWAGSASCCDHHMVGRDMLVGVFVRR